MSYEVIDSTVRRGLTVDEVQFPDGTTAYLLGHHGADDRPSRPMVVALHHQRGDKASLLPDLLHLAAIGFVCLSIDGTTARDRLAQRDHVGAMSSYHESTRLAIVEVTGGDTPDSDGTDTGHGDPLVIIGRGIGAEVAAMLATDFDTSIAVAVDPLVHRGQFLTGSAHPLAAGFRQFHADKIIEMTDFDGDLGSRLLATRDTHWLLQLGLDDDRSEGTLNDDVRFALPPVVRVDHYPTRGELLASRAQRDRISFITSLAG